MQTLTQILSPYGATECPRHIVVLIYYYALWTFTLQVSYSTWTLNCNMATSMISLTLDWTWYLRMTWLHLPHVLAIPFCLSDKMQFYHFVSMQWCIFDNTAPQAWQMAAQMCASRTIPLCLFTWWTSALFLSGWLLQDSRLLHWCAHRRGTCPFLFAMEHYTTSFVWSTNMWQIP